MESVEPQTLLADIEIGTAPVILDVRTAGEFRRGHVPGARHMPFQQVRARASEIPSAPDDPIVIYCGHGPRAWLAGRALRARGFRRVIYLKGHWAAWARAGLRRDP
jgi:rhodanese-related sulfurtransferase